MVNDLKTRSGCPLLTFALMISNFQANVISLTSAAELLADVITDLKSRFPSVNLPSTKDTVIKHFLTPEMQSEKSCMAPLVQTNMVAFQYSIHGENVASLGSLDKSLQIVTARDDLFKICDLIMLTLSYRFRQGHVVAALRLDKGHSKVLCPIDAQSEDFKCSPLVFLDVYKLDVYTLTEYGSEVIRHKLG